MIPKIIHYCWFGKNPLPQIAVDCIESWKKYCPDYEIMVWNEDNFDVNMSDYAKETAELNKWGLFTDYVRVYAVHKFGGIYIDTDIELIKNLDVFLKHKAFLCWQSKDEITFPLFGAEPENEWVEFLLNHYNQKHFVLEDKSFDYDPSPVTVTRLTKEFTNLKLDGTYQETDKGLVVYPQEYFSPIDYVNYNHAKLRLESITENTYAIHHYFCSWFTPSQKFKKKILILLGPQNNWLSSKFQKACERQIIYERNNQTIYYLYFAFVPSNFFPVAY